MLVSVQNSTIISRACIGVGLCVLLLLIATDDEVEVDVAPPPLEASRQEIGELLASVGLLEYGGVLESYSLLSVPIIASQHVENVPPAIKPYHWKVIIQEARKALNPTQHLTNGEAAAAEPSVPLPIEVLKDAPEDKVALEMPKTRTMGNCRVTRSFVPADKEREPPLFWSFPGSGNTWIRFLIEQATGFYTGSVYRDLDIIKVMPGELRCDRSVVAVKGHPNWTPFDLVDGAYKPDARWTLPDQRGSKVVENTEFWYGKTDINPRPTIKAFYKKCNAVEIDRALVVTRDPFAALWAEYQRVKSERVVNGTKEYGHIAKLAKADFDPNDMRYQVISLMQDWVLQFVGYEGFTEKHGCESVLFQPFEELVSPKTRDLSLARIAAHLRKPMVTTPECAFTLADHPAIRRDKIKDPAYMTIQDAYNDPRVGDLVCDMYEIAGPELKIFGYKPPPYGPNKGKCPPPKRSVPVISKHSVLTSGTLKCKSDRVRGMSSPAYHLNPDIYDSTVTPQEVETAEFLPKHKKEENVGKKRADDFEEVALEGVSFEHPYITMAITGRNDNHSGDVIQRTQNNLNNIASYADRYKIAVEVIIVEWNPEPERKPLANVLVLPNTTSGQYISIRVITVPPPLHDVYVPPPIHLPVQQYAGKNVAVRRARGEFVLCWNADMLLNGAFFDFLKTKSLRKGVYYRVDRIDFDKPFPPGFDIGNLEGEKERAWTELHAYQIRTAVGTRTIPTASEKATFWSDFHLHNDTTHRYALRCCEQQCERKFKSCRWKTWAGWSGDKIRDEVPKYRQRGQMGEIEDILNIPQMFHANAPGDFILMAKEDWMKLRGYPEAPFFVEIDKVFLFFSSTNVCLETRKMRAIHATAQKYLKNSISVWMQNCILTKC